MKKNYLSSLSPIHTKEEELNPVIVENGSKAPYLSDKNVPRKGPDKSVIPEDIVITGSLTATCDMDIFGTIHGNVSTAGCILLAGTVEGDIKAREVHFAKANLKGNVQADEMVVFEDASVIEGDIDTRDFILAGKLIGNIKASGFVNLKNTAVLTGDLEAATFEVSKGAVVNGSISIKK